MTDYLLMFVCKKDTVPEAYLAMIRAVEEKLIADGMNITDKYFFEFKPDLSGSSDDTGDSRHRPYCFKFTYEKDTYHKELETWLKELPELFVEVVFRSRNGKLIF